MNNLGSQTPLTNKVFAPSQAKKLKITGGSLEKQKKKEGQLHGVCAKWHYRDFRTDLFLVANMARAPEHGTLLQGGCLDSARAATPINPPKRTSKPPKRPLCVTLEVLGSHIIRQANDHHQLKDLIQCHLSLGEEQKRVLVSYALWRRMWGQTHTHTQLCSWGPSLARWSFQAETTGCPASNMRAEHQYNKRQSLP